MKKPTKQPTAVKRKVPAKKNTAVAKKKGAAVAANASSSILAGYLAGRSRFTRRAGLQFAGKRNLYETAGYIRAGEEQFEDYWGLYQRNEIAGRVIDLPCRTTWKTPPELVEPNQPDGTVFTEAFNVLAKRLQLWRYFEKADRLAGVGRYAVLVMGVRGTDARGMRQPLTRLSKPEDLIFLQAYHEGNARIARWNTDTGDPEFGFPQLYQLTLSTGVPGFNAQQTEVHASRIIHIAESPLEDDVFAMPRLQRILNRIFDLDKIAASVGESFWQSATRILQAQIDPNVTIQDGQMDELDDRLTEMIHDLRRQFTGQGTKLEWLSNSVEQPKSVGDFYFALISAGCGIPRRILFGNESGELASGTDQETYFGFINERQEQFAEPAILRLFVDRLIKFGALPAPSEDYEVVWPTLFEESEDSIASANLKRAQTAVALTPAGGDPAALVEIDEDRNVWLVPREPAPEEDLTGGAHLPLPPTPAGDPTLGADGLPTGDTVPHGTGGAGGETTPPADPNAAAAANEE